MNNDLNLMPDSIEIHFFDEWVDREERKLMKLDDDLSWLDDDCDNESDKDTDEVDVDYITKSLPANIKVEKLVCYCLGRNESLNHQVSHKEIIHARIGMQLIYLLIKMKLISLKRVEQLEIEADINMKKYEIKEMEDRLVELDR
ncbi:MAG: hypothetical protein HN764_16895 [Gammaproteobacteria bacterium]|nr:hypothetical protein [Gammaproteobacteria bacterium]